MLSFKDALLLPAPPLFIVKSTLSKLFPHSSLYPALLGAGWHFLSDPQSPRSTPVLLVIDGKVILGFGVRKDPRSRQKPHPRNPAFTNSQCDHWAPSSLFRTKTPQRAPKPHAHLRVQYNPEGKCCYAWTHTPAVTYQLCDTGHVP